MGVVEARGFRTFRETRSKISLIIYQKMVSFVRCKK
jgi:hypothetical protein